MTSQQTLFLVFAVLVNYCHFTDCMVIMLFYIGSTNFELVVLRRFDFNFVLFAVVGFRLFTWP